MGSPQTDHVADGWADQQQMQQKHPGREDNDQVATNVNAELRRIKLDIDAGDNPATNCPDHERQQNLNPEHKHNRIAVFQNKALEHRLIQQRPHSSVTRCLHKIK